MLKNLHLHYMGWRREQLERHIADLRVQAAAALPGYRQDRIYILIGYAVGSLNPILRELGLPLVSAYA